MGDMEKAYNKITRNIINCSGWVIYVALILIPFVASFSSAGANVFIGFSIFAYLVKKIAKREFPKENAIIIPFLLIILISLVSFTNSINFKSSWGGIGKLFTFGTLFIILAEEVRDIKHLKFIILATLFGLYMVSIDGAWQLYFGRDFLRNFPYDFEVIGIPRLKATFPHTNIFGGYLTLLLPFACSLAFYYLKGKRKLLLLLMSTLTLFCLVFTFSRSAILGFIVALIFMAIVKKDKLVLSLVLLGLIITPFVLPKNITNWVKNTNSVWEALLNKERIYIWKTSVNMIKAHPAIGSGTNTFCLNYHTYKPKDTYGATGDGYYAHNSFLHMAGEIGLLGLSIFLWLLFALFSCWNKFYYHSKAGPLLKICSLGIIAGIIAFLINGLTETNLYYPKVATLFWYQVGLFLGLVRINQEEKNG